MLCQAKLKLTFDPFNLEILTFYLITVILNVTIVSFIEKYSLVIKTDNKPVFFQYYFQFSGDTTPILFIIPCM